MPGLLPTPVEMINDGGDVRIAKTWEMYYQFLWEGYISTGDAPEPDRSRIPAHLSDLDALQALILSATPLLLWQPGEAVEIGTTRVTPDGSWVHSLAARVTRATYDPTEQSFWSTPLSIPGTREYTAVLEALNLAKEYAEQLRRSVSIREYGAALDGVTDDTAAWQAALDELAPLVGTSDERTIWFPNGTSLISAPLASNAPVCIVGENPRSARLLIDPAFPDGEDIVAFVRDGTSPGNESHVQGLVLKDFTIDGNLRGVAVRSALRLHRFDRAKIDITTNAIQGSALLVTHSLRESDVTLRAWLCGAGANRPVIDLNQDFSDGSAEGSNLNYFHGEAALNLGDQLRIRSSAGVVTRVNDFTDFIFHGMNEYIDTYVDMYGTDVPLETDGDVPCRIVIDNARSVMFDNCRLHLNGRGQPLFFLTDTTAGADTINTASITGSVMSYRGGTASALTLDSVDVAANTMQVWGWVTNRHHLQTGSRVQFTGAALPAGLVAGTNYYAIRTDDTNFKVAASRTDALAGVPVDITAVGTGTVTQYDFAAVVTPATDILTIPEHRFATGARVRVDGTVLPGGVADNVTDFFLIRVDADNVKLATTYANALAGTAIDLTSAGTAVFLTTQDFLGYVANGTLTFDFNQIDGPVPQRAYFRVKNGAKLITGVTNSWSADTTHKVAEYESGASHSTDLHGGLWMRTNNHPIYLSKADGAAIQAMRMSAIDEVLLGALSGADPVNVVVQSLLGAVRLYAGTEKFRAGQTGISFFGAAEVAKQTINGTRDPEGALKDLLTKLANMGFVTDASTPAVGSWSRSIDCRAQPISISAGAWSTNGSYGFNSNGSTTTGAAATWVSDMDPGTWRIDFVSFKSANAGIINVDYSLDGGSTWVNMATNLDLYSAASTGNDVAATGIVIAAKTKVLLRVTATGTKNASSSAYFVPALNWTLQRTA